MARRARERYTFILLVLHPLRDTVDLAPKQFLYLVFVNKLLRDNVSMQRWAKPTQKNKSKD